MVLLLHPLWGPEVTRRGTNCVPEEQDEGEARRVKFIKIKGVEASQERVPRGARRGLRP